VIIEEVIDKSNNDHINKEGNEYIEVESIYSKNDNRSNSEGDKGNKGNRGNKSDNSSNN
jgi:hypothetical protein